MNKITPVQRKGGKGAETDKKSAVDSQDDPKTAELLARIRKRMDKCIGWESDNRKDALDDLKFKAGNQWPAQVAAQRNNDQRPCLTINGFPTLIHQITNPQRENRPGINISPVGDRSDPEVAKMLKGMIREIERESNADEAYDTAFDGAVSNGFGYWRVNVDYEAPDSMNQVVRIVRIRNPFTVYLDPESKDSIGSDAEFGFITEMIPRDEYRDEYPGSAEMNFDQAGIGESLKNWVQQDAVRVAEYFEKEYETRKLVALSNGWTGWEDELADEVKDQIEDGSVKIKRERESRVPHIKWYKVNAVEVLDERDWVGDYIPIIRVPGDEIDIEGKVKFFGVIRMAKDAQRMKNYWKTLFTELVALAPKAPWVVEEGQIEGYEDQWKAANIKSLPYLQYKGTSVGGTQAPPPQRQQFAQIPAGVVQGALEAEQDIMSTTGVRFNANPNERLMDESGIAINELRRNTDIGAFHFTDNLSRALMHTGVILIDLIRKVYDTPRVATILREDDSEELVEVDPSAPKPVSERRMENGKIRKIFNPTYGKYGVTVTIGPSYATRRIEAASSMMEFARAFPPAAQIIMDLIAKNMDWEGAEEIAKRLAKAIPPQYLTPDMKDVPPQVQAMLQNLEMQVKQLVTERGQLAKALDDKQQDRALELKKIDNDFEAKLMKIVADVETKAAATHEKAVASFNAHVGSRIDALVNEVEGVKQTFDKQDEEARKAKDEEAKHPKEDPKKVIVDAMTPLIEEHIGKMKKELSGPKKVKIIRGPDGFATGAEIEREAAE